MNKFSTTAHDRPDPPLDRLLQISMAAFVALGTVLLGLGQNSLLWPLIAIAASAGSVYLTDVKRWLVINNTMSNVAAWLALLVSLWHLNSIADIDSLQAMSELLVYLQIILLFKKKNVRNYWLLIVSSLLQVSVGAALSMDVLFGVVLVGYMFVGLFALTVFYLYRERTPAESPAAVKAVALPPPSNCRWPLAGQVATIESAAPAASLGVGWDLYRRVFGSGLVTLVIAVGLFLLVPRVERASPWRLLEGGSQQRHMVGFSQEVQLGEFGPIAESPSRVMRIRFTDPDTDEPYPLADVPLLRGVTLTYYDNGRWAREMQDTWSRTLPSSRDIHDMPLVKQTVEMEPLDTNVLFCVHPPVAVPGDRNSLNVFYDPRREFIHRPQAMMNQDFHFELLTYGLRKSKQRPTVPCRRRLGDYERAQLLLLPRKDGELSVPGLAALANELVANIPVDNVEQRARALEHYLRSDDRFRYSLGGQPRDPRVDPIEDFITTHPSGHCEYFASALALMCRSVGIPTRLAVGFRGGAYNNSTHWYEVQQLHAHTWVEAYLDPTEAASARGPSAAANGSWLTLDPTPGADDLAEADDGYASYFRMVRDYAQTLWSEYVVGMDADRQRDSVYKPLSESLSETLQSVFERFRSLQAKLVKLLSVSGQGGWFDRGFTGWSLVEAVLVLSSIAAMGWTIVALMRRRGRWWPGRSARGPAGRSNIEFYRRLEAVLARQRLTRSIAQTQREFAVAAGGQLCETPRTAALASLPRRVVDAFYRVRFGGRPLDNQEAQAVEEALSQLETGLTRR